MTALLVVSCTEYKFEDKAIPQEADVMISIASRNTDSQDGLYTSKTRASENDINSAIVLVYNASQIFEKSQDMGAGQPVTLTLREGKKYIFVVANPCDALKAKLIASPTYTALNKMLSEAGDYNAGAMPVQGLLMSGVTEQTIAAGSNNTATVALKYCVSRVELYIRKGSNDVDNITVSSVELNNARNKGYLFKADMYTATTTNTATIINKDITGYTAGSDGTLITAQYTYPTVNATNIAFAITLRHANTSSDDTYIIYLNNDNSSTSGTTLQPNYKYKVIVTFSKDESGKLTITAFTEKSYSFNIG